jgi:AcrR family transcriptional regulator
MGTTAKRSAKKPAAAARPGGARAGSKSRVDVRAAKAEERRNAILKAALDEFSERGFAAARLDDVARRAGVAKGTIYLYFKDKEALFQELVRFQIGPVVGALETVLASELPLKVIVDNALDIFVREIYGTHRKQVLRLIISEGPRFPALAEFYYREVLAHILKAVRARLARAVERGEIDGDELVRFPQLLGAPGIVAIVWSGLFDRFEPLDVRAMLRAYFDRLFGPRRQP